MAVEDNLIGTARLRGEKLTRWGELLSCRATMLGQRDLVR